MGVPRYQTRILCIRVSCPSDTKRGAVEKSITIYVLINLQALHGLQWLGCGYCLYGLSRSGIEDVVSLMLKADEREEAVGEDACSNQLLY